MTPRLWNLRVLTCALVFLGCTAAYVSEQFLSWDASWHLFWILQEETFLRVPHRPSMMVLQLPALVAHGLTEDLPVLIKAYGSLYAFVPFISVSLVAWLTRGRDTLFTVAVLGICGATLANQYLFHSEHLVAVHIFWVLMALLVQERWTWSQLVGITLLGLFITGLHPAAIVLLAIAAFYVLVWRRSEDESVLRWLVGAGLVVLMGLRISSIAFSEMDQRSLTVEWISSRLFREQPLTAHVPLRDYALLFMLLMAPVGPLMVWRASRARALCWAFLALACTALFAWLHADPDSLAYSRLSRFLIVFNALVPYGTFLFMAHRQEPTRSTLPFAPVLAVVFLAFLLDVGALRARHLRRVDEFFAGTNESCKTLSAFDERHASFLEHWALTYEYMLYRRSRQPRRLIVSRSSCSDVNTGEAKVKLSPWGAEVPVNAYFDLRHVLSEVNGSTSDLQADARKGEP